jgi:hypothetical protein
VKHFGRDSYLGKTDVEDAFRNFDIHPSDYHLLGFTWNGFYYYDKCLPMGASSSCQVFEKCSCALQWIMETKPFGYDRSCIRRNLPLTALGTKPKGEHTKFLRGFFLKGPAILLFRDSLANFSNTLSGSQPNKK